jgi:hypothetical protein
VASACINDLANEPATLRQAMIAEAKEADHFIPIACQIASAATVTPISVAVQWFVTLCAKV